MSGQMIIELISRWAHVGAAIVLVGGAVFTRYVLLSAAGKLDQASHDTLRESVRNSWKKFVMVGIGLLLVSGFYNYLVVARPKHSGDGLYHALMGVKMLLAFAAFFLASALTGRSAALEPIRKNSKRWLGILILLSALVVGIGGFLKMRGTPQRAVPEDVTSAVAPETRLVISRLTA
ncbi:hypothetical protein Mal4_21220 [Maioricimonas rarisocia]|uniref:Copper resistance protein D n=1 Tax=Maioricimonas rarisocia TaxID=2528026 RepID=A0A517Z5R9_9PLAN|nr:hypothetical protein [Maioricimonas rarisocia]QDU37805.1 hypothetical protein Mal4_21220 [Maioricimonas rarisocia]